MTLYLTDLDGTLLDPRFARRASVFSTIFSTAASLLPPPPGARRCPRFRFCGRCAFLCR